MQEPKRTKEQTDSASETSQHELTEGSMRALEDADTETKALIIPASQHITGVATRTMYVRNSNIKKDTVRRANASGYNHQNFSINTLAEVRDKLTLSCEKLEHHLVSLLEQNNQDIQREKFVRFECCVLIQLRRNIVSHLELSYSDAVINDSVIEFVNRADFVLDNIQKENVGNIEYYLEVTYDLICEAIAFGVKVKIQKDKWRILRDKYRQIKENRDELVDVKDIYNDIVDVFNSVYEELEKNNPRKTASLFDKMFSS